MIVIAGLGSIGSFLYFLLSQKGYKPLVFSKRQELQPFEVFCLSKNERKFIAKIENIARVEGGGKIEYLFLSSKAFETKNYLKSILLNYEVKRIILTQNGIGLEEEVREMFPGNIYYLTFTTALEFNNSQLTIFNLHKSQAVLTSINNQEKDLLDFEIDINSNYCLLSYSFNHLKVRFSKLILNLILNVVPSAFEELPWQVFPNNPEAVKMEKDLIREICNFIDDQRLGYYNFKGYNTYFISQVYKNLPFSIFRIFYSNPNFLKKLRNDRVPSFYNDLILKGQKTEVEYYLGWFKKYPNYDLSTVKFLYNRIIEMEGKYCKRNN